jgi:hypothetical protein
MSLPLGEITSHIMFYYVIRIEDLHFTEPPINKVRVDQYDPYKHLITNVDGSYHLPMRDMSNDAWLMVYNDRYAS